MRPITTYETLSILAQFSIVLISALTLIVTIVVILDKKK
ncbi:putative holin-like toxin [Aciduricibacillus chroicocephali]